MELCFCGGDRNLYILKTDVKAMSMFTTRKNSDSGEPHPALFRPPVFEKLKDRDLEIVYSVATEREYQPGDLIIRQGDPRRSFFLIVDGAATVQKDFNGAIVNIGRLSKGDIVGEIAFISKNPRSASAVADSRSRLLEFSPESFDRLPERVQLLVFKYLSELAENRLENLILQNHRMIHVEKRLSDYIHKKSLDGARVLASPLIQEIIHNIPKLPMYTRELAVKLLDEGVTPKEVAESIKLDPSLAVMVLKTVNSPYFGLPQKISDFSRAVVLLGFTQVYQLVLYQGVHSLMPKGEQFKELQERSYLLSLISYEVSLLTHREKAGANSTIGLLSDVGKSVILLLKRKNPKIADIIGALEHTSLGAALLKSWEMPERMCRLIELQDHPEYLPPAKIPKDCVEDLSVLHIAKVCHRYLMKNGENHESAYFGDYMAGLNFGGFTLERFAKEKILPALLKNELRVPAGTRIKLHRLQYEE